MQAMFVDLGLASNILAMLQSGCGVLSSSAGLSARFVKVSISLTQQFLLNKVEGTV
jgi:hypothetical protein